MSKTKYDEKDYQRDLTKERDDRCIPVAKEVLKMIAAADGFAGNTKQELIQQSYDQLAKDILQYYLDNNILVSEANFIGQLILQIINASMSIVSTSINTNLTNVQKMAFGKDINEVTFKELDDILKEVDKIE